MESEKILGLVRHVLTAAGGAFVILGWTDDGMVQEFVGAAMTLIGMIWSWQAKNV